MFVLSLIGQKGGSGKTTIALGLAVAARRCGKVTVVIDIDPQATAANWKDRRADESPAVVSAQASRLAQTLAAAKEMGAEIVIIDTAGRSDSNSLAASSAASIVLIPSRANIAELETLSAARNIVRLGGNPPAFVVLNGIHPSATKQASDARNIVRETFGLETAPVHLCHRAAYADAMATGQTPQELDPEGKAAAELDALFRFCIELNAPVAPATPKT